MGRLKKDHSGYRTYGLYLKYQSPTINERPIKAKSKKDTNKWCRGKVGVEHEWHRYQDRAYDWELEDYVKPYVHIQCAECHKSKFSKTAKAANYPLHLYIYTTKSEYELVQVRVNGEYMPVDYFKYLKDKYFCKSCGTWH